MKIAETFRAVHTHTCNLINEKTNIELKLCLLNSAKIV